MTQWNHPDTVENPDELMQVLCRVLHDDMPSGGFPRSVHCAVSSGDHAEGDLFVSIGHKDTNNDAESGWFVAGWDMNQDCWTDARRYEVIGWLPIVPAAISEPQTAEERYIEDCDASCPACGGSGHADDAGPYVIWSDERRAWWRPKSGGYTLHLSAAGRYTQDDALKICRNARAGWQKGDVPSEIPILLADALACEERPKQD